MAEKDPTDPSATSTAYDAMVSKWHIIQTLLDGTEAMRSAGETYLPRHEEETDERYEERRKTAVLFNFVEDTLKTLSAKPFSQPVQIGEDVPAVIKDKLLMDVDLQGNNLNVFAKDWFKVGMAKALAHVLIDFPKTQQKENGQPRTLDDDRKEGLRPYWSLIQPERLIFARAEVINGVEVLQHVRILETYVEQKGFVEVEKTRIRVLEPGWVYLYVPEKRAGKMVWVLEDQWPTGLLVVPLVTFYAHRTGFMQGKPPLLDLAHLNVTHWQSAADQRHILTVARFPILACSGASKDDSDPVIIGSNKVLYNPDPQGKFYYVEHAGQAIQSGRDDLKDIEARAATYGSEFLRDKPGGETATARALDSAESSSDLSAMAGMFEDAVAQALDLTAQWMKLAETGGTVALIKDYSENDDKTDLDALAAARKSRDISRKTYVEGLRVRGVLPDDFDADEDFEELQDEASALMETMTELDQTQAGGTGEPDKAKKPAQKGAGKPTKAGAEA
jgi:hypothetical protein